MTLKLRPATRKLIEQRVKSGKYSTPDDVVLAAMASLAQQEQFGDFQLGELDQLLAEGEKSLRERGPIPAEAVFKELEQRSARRRTKTA